MLLLRCTHNARILLANLLQRSRSTFSRGSFLSLFAFKEGIFDTQISALGGWPTVSARYCDRLDTPAIGPAWVSNNSGQKSLYIWLLFRMLFYIHDRVVKGCYR